MFKLDNVLDNDKYLCPECGSVYKMNTQSHNRHIKSKTHLKAIGKEDEFDGEAQKSYTQQFREKLKREIGEDEYRKLETIERANRRRKEKQKQQPAKETKTVLDNKTKYEKILEKFKRNNPNLMEKTIEKNLKNVAIAYKKLFNKEYDYSTINFLTTNPLATVKKIVKIYKDEDKSEKTISNILASIASIIKGINKEELQDTIDIYSNASILFQKRVEKQLDTGNLKEKQKDWFNWSNIKSLGSDIDEFGTTLEKGLYHLYTDIAPRRIIDYSMMKVVKSTDDFVIIDDELEYNYLIVDEEYIPEQMIISKYKNPAKKKWAKELGTDGIYTVDIKDPLQDNLDQYIADSRIKSGDFLFSKNGKPYTESEFSKLISEMLNKYTDTNMTLNSLRHSYASHMLKKAKNMKEKKKIAWEMGSSVDTLLKNYDKHELS